MSQYETAPDNAPRASHVDRSRWIYGILAILLAVGVGAWVYSSTRPHPAKVVKQDITGQIPLDGTIVIPPNARADVYSPFAAPVEKVVASVGKHVEKGDLLVTLQITNAEAYHEQTKQTLQQAETAYANARNQLEGPVAAAQRQLDAARAAARNTRSAQPAQTGQTDTNSPAPAPTTDTTTDVAAAEAALQQAIANRDAQLVAYKQQLDAAREANSQARAGERTGEIRSPITGTVLALNAQTGQTTGTDRKTPLATVVDLSAIQVQAAVGADVSAYVKQGMPVKLTLKELPGKEFTGRISNITTQVQERVAGLIKNQQTVALVDFKNTDALVRPGMTPAVAAETGQVRNALAVPIDAVDTDSSGRPVVHALRGGNWQDVAVNTGVSDGRVIQIKSGVNEGETIKVTPDILHAASPLGKR